MVTYSVRVILGINDEQNRLSVKCHDTGVNLIVYPYIELPATRWRKQSEPYSIPAGSTAVLIVAKQDKTRVTIDGEVNGSNCSFKLPPQTFTAAGSAAADCSIYGPDGRRITTGTFYIDIPEECACACNEESGDYTDLFGEQIDAVNKAEAGAKAAEAAALYHAEAAAGSESKAMQSETQSAENAQKAEIAAQAAAQIKEELSAMYDGTDTSLDAILALEAQYIGGTA